MARWVEGALAPLASGHISRLSHFLCPWLVECHSLHQVQVPSYLSDLFEGLDKKLKQINEKMGQIKDESDSYHAELAELKA